jgi:hypothetical protein
MDGNNVSRQALEWMLAPMFAMLNRLRYFSGQQSEAIKQGTIKMNASKKKKKKGERSSPQESKEHKP